MKNIIIRNTKFYPRFKENWIDLLRSTGSLTETPGDRTVIGDVFEYPGWIIISYPLRCDLPEEYMSFLRKTFGRENIILE